MTRLTFAVALAVAALVLASAPAPAQAGVTSKVCGAIGGVTGKACDLLRSPGKALSAGKDLITGHVGSFFNDLFGGGSSGGASSTASTALAITAVVAWAVGGAKLALHETAKLVDQTTRPQLRTAWFSSAYWRMAGIAALLTVPLLFAAAVQALMHSDLALLARATFGYLPLAMIAIGIAAPLTMLLLAATDQLCGLVSAAGGGEGARALKWDGVVVGLAGAAGAPFITFLFASITTAGAIVLWLELAIREAAVYVVVLMLPLAFAALVWPARRVWAVRTVEVLVALILSKFAIVAVLSLGGAALGHDRGVGTILAGTVLVLLSAFAPWAVLRLLPLSELASGAIGSIRPQLASALPDRREQQMSDGGWAQAIASAMRQQADGAATSSGGTRGSSHSDCPRLPDQTDGMRGREVDGAPALDGDERAAAAALDGDGRAVATEAVQAESATNGASAHDEAPDNLPTLDLGIGLFDEEGRYIGPRHEFYSREDFEKAGEVPLSHEPGDDRDPLPPPQDEDPL